jgi:hypothetical protein
LDDAIAKSLERFRNRKIHNAITVDLLNQLTDSDLEQALIDYIGTRLGDDYKREREIISGLKPGLRALYITWWVEALSAVRVAKIRAMPDDFTGA